MELPATLASIHEFLKDWPVIFFFVIHMTVGRTLSVTTGVLLLHISPLYLIAYALIGDLLNVPFFVALYEWISKTMRRSERLSNWIDRSRERRKQGGLYSRMAKLGGVGVIILSALPMCGAGMWSSILLAWSLRMKPLQATSYLSAGSIVGSLVALVLAFGIKGLLHIL